VASIWDYLPSLTPTGEAVVQGAKAIGKGLWDTATLPARQMQPNPYPAGTEEAQWYADNNSRQAYNWGPEMALNMIGVGGPAAMAGATPKGALGAAGAKSAGLPMDEASRMARATEQGYDVNNKIYHGSPTMTEGQNFSLAHPARTDTGYLGSGVYTTPSKWVADVYATPPKGPGRGETLEMVAKKGNYKDVVYDSDYKKNLEAIAKEHGVDTKFGEHSREWTQNFGEAMRKAGYDGVRGVNYDGTIAEMVTFDPSRLRSVNAKFDPANDGKNMLLGSGTSDAKTGAAIVGMNNSGGIKAYHGSPHDFDRFDLSKIGTGEGAQAYGHGLYFADKEAVAKQYRDVLASRSETGTPEGVARFWANMYGRDGGIKHLEDVLKQREKYPKNYTEPVENTHAAIKYLRDGGDLTPAGGKMYEVNINAHPDQFLDWDKPLGQHAPDVKKAAYGVAKNHNPENTVQSLIEQLGTSMHRPGLGHLDSSLASGALREAGIPGIKYLDQGSRGSGAGSSNYVVFDDKLIDILRKYGIALPGAAAGSQMLGANQPAPMVGM
jgi:hypothetical protein